MLHLAEGIIHSAYTLFAFVSITTTNNPQTIMVNDNFMLCILLAQLDYSTIDYKNRAKSNLLTYMARKSDPFIAYHQII
jgi:hypothetical protein